MKPGIKVSNIWSDVDVVELKIKTSDGKSQFTNTAYVGWGALEELVSDLKVFRRHIHGGVLDICFGAFGPEYANGALKARLHFQMPGIIRVSVEAQSDFEEFGRKTVASQATLFFNSEPVLLDNFIAALTSLYERENTDATLEGI